MTEQEVNATIANWRQAEEDKQFATDVAERAKERMIEAVHSLGLRTQEVPGLGKVTLSPYDKLAIVVDRKDFEQRLKHKGLYDQFLSTAFDLAKVKAYARRTGDDLNGMIELDTGFRPTFTKAPDARDTEGRQ